MKLTLKFPDIYDTLNEREKEIYRQGFNDAYIDQYFHFIYTGKLYANLIKKSYSIDKDKVRECIPSDDLFISMTEANKMYRQYDVTKFVSYDDLKTACDKCEPFLVPVYLPTYYAEFNANKIFIIEMEGLQGKNIYLLNRYFIDCLDMTLVQELDFLDLMLSDFDNTGLCDFDNTGLYYKPDLFRLESISCGMEVFLRINVTDPYYDMTPSKDVIDLLNQKREKYTIRLIVYSTKKDFPEV